MPETVLHVTDMMGAADDDATRKSTCSLLASIKLADGVEAEVLLTEATCGVTNHDAGQVEMLLT